MHTRAFTNARLAFALAFTWSLTGAGHPAAAQHVAEGAARMAGVVLDESGGVLPGVTVTLTASSRPAVPLMEVVTDAEGAFEVDGVGPGEYTLVVSLSGFQEQQQTILLRAGDSIVRRFTLALTAFSEVVEVVATAARVDQQRSTGEAQVVERVLAAVPLAKERFEDALPLLPSTIRGPDGLLNMSGTRANQSTLLMNGVNGTDPVTGQFAIRLPLEAVEALNVQAGVLSAQFGNATGGVTNVVTRPGQDTWDFQFQNFLPRFRFKEGGVRGVDAFTPRLRLAGPIQRGRLWFAETANYRFVRSRVTELESRGLDRSEQQFESFDAVTQIDYAVRPTHRLVGTFVWFPNNIDNVQIDTLHPFEATPDLRQRGWNAAVAERAVLGAATTFDTSFSVKQFDVGIQPKTLDPSEITITGVRGNYFNRFDRDSRRYDASATLTTLIGNRAGDHLVKAGSNVARTSYDGTDASLPILVRRADGSLAQRVEFVGDPAVRATNTEVAGFVEDQWSPLSRLTVHIGARYAYEGIAAEHTLAPRLELAVRPFSGAGTVLKAGYGRFYDKLPLNAKDFTAHQRRHVARFEATGRVIPDSIVTLDNRVAAGGLRTPLSDAWNVELDQRLATDLTLRVGYQERHGSRELVVDPLDEALSLSSRGRSRSRSLEVTVQRRLARSGEVNVSYVRSQAFGNLNDFVSLFGTTRDPIIRPDEFSRQPFDAPNRFLAWGVVMLPHDVTVAPTVEYRTGFPYTVVDERQGVVGSRNRGGRFPDLFTLDLAVTKEVRLTGTHRARVGIQVFNLTDHFNPRDVQNNVSSLAFREFANSADRQVRLKFVLLF
ncbi:MAG: TonB-dependent receptor [Acidobacteria bacterium]|nr:TonB-dependent receptor [Acidobacteriota bacterium]